MLLFFSVICSSGLLFAIWMTCAKVSGIRSACWISAVAGILASCLSPVLFLQAVGTLLIGLFCLKFKSSAKTMFVASVGVTVLSYGAVTLMSLAEIRENDKLRAEFPVVSLAERLEYERVRPISSENPEGERVRLGGEVERRLESSFAHGSRMRRFMLGQLHDRKTDEFVMARGFGPVRMIGVRKERIDLPEPPPIPLPDNSKITIPYQAGENRIPSAEGTSSSEMRSQEGLLTFHIQGLQQFLDSERMGYVKDKEHVAGFQPHRFLAMPEPPSQSGETWRVARLELISLLKHGTPVAYVSRNLPQMDELKTAPTRKLDTFEQKSLARLQHDEDIVFHEGADEIRMVGSIRAGQRCLSCHSVGRGELLGAFSYHLVRSSGTRRQPANETTAGPQAQVFRNAEQAYSQR